VCANADIIPRILDIGRSQGEWLASCYGCFMPEEMPPVSLPFV